MERGVPLPSRTSPAACQPSNVATTSRSRRWVVDALAAAVDQTGQLRPGQLAQLVEASDQVGAVGVADPFQRMDQEVIRFTKGIPGPPSRIDAFHRHGGRAGEIRRQGSHAEVRRGALDRADRDDQAVRRGGSGGRSASFQFGRIGSTTACFDPVNVFRNSTRSVLLGRRQRHRHQSSVTAKAGRCRLRRSAPRRLPTSRTVPSACKASAARCREATAS